MVETNMKILEEVGSGKFFDKLLDFQNDDVEDGSFELDVDAFPPVWLDDDSPAFVSAGRFDQPPVHRSVRYEDIVQLEWLSNFVQDSLSKVRAPPICHAKRARSKRPRPATFNPRAAIQLIPPLKKSLGSLNRQSHNENSIKKCTHCQVTTTAMWRGGPNGPRTLCNACGLRYGLGRLCPEYRPGARVSFMSSHSPHSDPLKKRPEQPSKKQKIRPLCGGTDRQSHNQNEDPNAHPWRMCTSCQSTENLQWRASKYGPKMICSACRCRNKSNQSVARPTFNPFEASQFVPSTYILDTSPSKKTLEQPKCKKKAKSSPLSGVSNGQSQNQKDDSSAKPRVKCSHCEVTHSSQWRKGPNGPGTLCNACGIRYRSGKLLPEYRPVASPTFVPSVHSNSHRKVIEIRSSKNHEETTSCKPELLPYSIFDKDAPEQEDAVLAIPSSMPELLPYSISDKDTPEQEDAILAVPSSMPELLPYSMSDKDAPEQEDAILAEPISMPELLPYSISDNDTPEQEDAILAVPSSMPELLPYSISDQDTPEQENAIQAVPSFTPELTPNSAFGDKLPETRNSTNTMDESLMTEVPIIFHPELLQMCNIVSNQD